MFSRLSDIFKPDGNRVPDATASQRVGLLVLWMFLFSPLTIQATIGGWRELSDVLFLVNAGISVLWMALAHFSVRRPVVLHLALAPLYLTTGVDLFLLVAFQGRLTSGYVNVGLSNGTDIKEFLSTYVTLPILTMLLLFIAVYTAGVYCIRGVRNFRSARFAWLAAAALLGIYGLEFTHFVRIDGGIGTALLDVAAHETSAPMGAVFQTAVAVKLHSDYTETIARRARHSFGAWKAPSSDNEIYVWVIGESARPANWSLFGYYRDTSPRLRAVQGIIGFPDMMTTAPHTSVAVPSMLSLQPITDWPSVLAHKSIVAAFNEAGFKTYWLSVQDADGWAGIIPQLAAESSTCRYFTQSVDGMLVAQLREIIQSTARDGNSKLLIVLHTKGSHFDYERRYPPEFALYSTPHGTRREKIVDAYDNTIFYTDWFLAELISVLAERNTQAALLYASDHGENLLDDDRQLLGHALGTKYDLATASFVWLSTGLRQRHPDWVLNADRNAKLPLSLSNLSHSMLELAGIQAPALDLGMSVFSSGFKPHARSYLLRGVLRGEQTATVIVR